MLSKKNRLRKIRKMASAGDKGFLAKTKQKSSHFQSTPSNPIKLLVEKAG